MSDIYRTRAVVREIEHERGRQRRVEGWTPEHDDTHVNGEMARAAACYTYVAAASDDDRAQVKRQGGSPYLWPWSSEWWKPKDRRRDLVRAAALIVAEIERLDRTAAKAGPL